MVASGLGTSVLAGWAVSGAIKSGRIVAAEVGREGIQVPWFAATRSGDAEEDIRNHRLARQLADWCRDRGGLVGGQS